MATIDYDNIQLSLTSAFNDKGAEEAIDNLGDIKKGLDNLDSSNVKEVAKDFRDFADAVNSVSTRSLDDIVKGAIKRANIPRASSLTDEEVEYGRTVEWSGETSSAIESAKELKQALVDVQEDARQAYEDLYAYLSAYPKTSNSYLKNQMGFDDDTIAHVRQDLYVASVNAKETASGVGQIGKEAKKSLSPIEKIAQRLKNLVIYRMLRSVVSGMANAIKEGFSNLESWDRATGMTGFAESMDRARASLTVLKNSLAVVGAPFLEYLINILSRVASWAMTAANAISRMIAILSGKSSYRAVKWADAVADSQASAAGSAKKATQEFKKQLMAFDEINNLTAPSDGSNGSGGGGGSASSANEMFEERSVGELGDWGKFLQKIGEAWREMSERIRTANDATSRHLNSIKEVVKAWKDFFTDPKTNFSKWSEDFASSVETIKGNVKDFIQGFKEARESGAGYLEAIQAGLDNIGKSKVPQQLANNFADTLNATEAKFKNLDGSTAVGFAHMKENSILVSDNMKLKLGGAFNQIQNDGEKAFNGIDTTIQTKAINPVGALSGALNNVFGRTYTLTLQTNEVVNRTVHVNEVLNQIQGKGYTSYYKYASGGFPTQGQMFIAREAGPELVGTIGGQTAVVNNSDIVASVSQGVAQAVASVLGGGQQVNVTLEGDAKNLFKVVQREGRAYSARTGQPALA